MLGRYAKVQGMVPKLECVVVLLLTLPPKGTILIVVWSMFVLCFLIVTIWTDQAEGVAGILMEV